jgi:hypothetical protein
MIPISNLWNPGMLMEIAPAGESRTVGTAPSSERGSYAAMTHDPPVQLPQQSTKDDHE